MDAKKEPIEETVVKDTEEGGVEVTLEKETDEEQEVQVETKVDEHKEDLKRKNAHFAQQRIISKLQEEVEELRKSRVEPAPVVEDIPMDELDKLAQTDWKAAVKKLARQEAQALDRTRQEQIAKQSEQESYRTALANSEKIVLGKYPELNDNTSEHSQIWLDVLSQHPDWRKSPYGPTLVMREMEDVLRSKGYDIDGRTTKEVKQEQSRLARVNAASLDSPRTAPSNKIILSKEQREFCDTNGISYENYARTLRRVGDGGLEL